MTGERDLAVVAGTGNPGLVATVATALDARPATVETQRFPDGELHAAVGPMRGADAYVLQPTGPPVDSHLMELLLLLDACRRAGAARITAVVPYFGYARQDRRRHAGEAVGARLVADLLAASAADRLVVLDPHTAALEAMSSVPVEMLTAVPVLSRAFATQPSPAPADVVVVAPDLGAVRLAERVAVLLGRSVAVVRKSRLTGTTVRVEELVGDVAGRPAVVVDDMISTGSTIEAAVGMLRAHGAGPAITVAATHGLLVAGAPERLGALGLHRLLLTDSLPRRGDADRAAEEVTTVSVALLLADAIGRLHREEPLDGLLVRA